MTHLRYPPELERHRARHPFNSTIEGARYGLAREVSIAIWERVCAEATDATSAADLKQAQRRFHEIAAQLAARGGQLSPDVGKLTRVGVELDGDSRAVPGTAQLGLSVPGRKTLVTAEARPWRHLDAAAIQRDDEAGLTTPRERPGPDEVRQAMAALQVPLPPEQPVPDAVTRTRPTMSLLFGGATFLEGAVRDAAGAIDRFERGHEGLGRLMLRREQRGGASAAPPTVEPAAREPTARAQADGDLDDLFGIHLSAARGVAGGGATLPHLKEIQASFGHHHVGDVRAHVGSEAVEAAAAIGASAYATGDDVAFVAAPDLHQAAHEAAHVVQQRGGVRLDGGVGRAGDAYERHADAVADLVVRGESAEALLDTMAHRGSAGGPAVQGDFHTEPLTTPHGEASEHYSRDGLHAANLDQLYAAYTMAAPADPATPVTVGTATVTYAWLRGRIGTVVMRGEIRSHLQALTPPDRGAQRAVVGALTGDPARVAELRALVEEADVTHGPGGSVLLDERDGAPQTFLERPYRSPGHPPGAMHLHAASDISARPGTGVYAPCAGTVVYSGGGRGYGNLVRIQHPAPPPTPSGGSGPLESVYAHLSARLVAVGDTVAVGQAIALTGRSAGDEHGDAGSVAPFGLTAAHLHMSLIQLPRSAVGGRVYSHSSRREARIGIRPDDWLRELGVSVSAAPLFRMDEGEATTADADGVARGGVTRVSRRATGGAALAGDAALSEAARGVRDAATPLPHHERLQTAFGRHDLGGVTAHVGGDAAEAAGALGAAAYTDGDRIAFAIAPSLHLAAHEAAHVIQQRHGAVADGLGEPGDRHERHADRVADAVLRGESAEALLDEVAGGAARASAAAVQRWGGGDSDTMRAHHERGELHRRHGGDDLGPAPDDGEVVHGGGDPHAPLDRAGLDDELVRAVLRRHGEDHSLVPIDYVERTLRAQASHADVSAVYEPIIITAGTMSWEVQMQAIDNGAGRLLHAVETHWVHDPAVSGLDILGDRAGRYRDFDWDTNDFPGSPAGSHVARRSPRDPRARDGARTRRVGARAAREPGTRRGGDPRGIRARRPAPPIHRRAPARGAAVHRAAGGLDDPAGAVERPDHAAARHRAGRVPPHARLRGGRRRSAPDRRRAPHAGGGRAQRPRVGQQQRGRVLLQPHPRPRHGPDHGTLDPPSRVRDPSHGRRGRGSPLRNSPLALAARGWLRLVPVPQRAVALGVQPAGVPRPAHGGGPRAAGRRGGGAPAQR